MSEYVPNSWVLFQIEHKGQLYYKVLGGWSGSYLEGSSWKLNSGISSYEEDGDYILFHGYSGSTYKCHKASERVSMAMQPTYTRLSEAPEAKEVSYEEFKKIFVAIP